MRFIFSRESLSNGINFGDKGPGDQGAYHEFYQGKFYVVGLPSFNWKAYWDFNPHAKIVHFHGPKSCTSMVKLKPKIYNKSNPLGLNVKSKAVGKHYPKYSSILWCLRNLKRDFRGGGKIDNTPPGFRFSKNQILLTNIFCILNI